MSTQFKQVKNNAKSYALLDALDNTDITLAFDLEPTEGDKFPDTASGSFWVTAWNVGRYLDPGDDPDMRIGLASARADDELTVTWGLFGTPVNAIPGRPAIAVTLLDQHMIDIHGAINDLEDGRNHKVELTVGPDFADYIVDGTDDNVQIQQALDAVNAAGGGVVRLQKYTFDEDSVSGLTVGNKTIIEGSGVGVSILRKANGRNSSILVGKDSTNGNEFIRVRHLTIDQNGVNQTAGAGINFQGLRDSIFEDVVFEKAYNFCAFIQSIAGTLLTGTLTFTKDSEIVSGSGTAFTTELAVGQIVKSAGGRFQRIATIVSNTSMRLDRAWGWATEAGVSARMIPANARNLFDRCIFNGTVINDNFGFGLLDDSVLRNCISRNSANYGYGADHCNRLTFDNCIANNNANAGFGIETCGDSLINGGQSYRNSKGVYLLSGAYRNVVRGIHVRHNTGAGVEITYNTTSFPTPDDNTIDVHASFNGTHGVRVGGAFRTRVDGRFWNNGQFGVVTVTDNGRVPDATRIAGHCFDDQTVKTQDRGVYILNGTNSIIDGVIAKDTDHTIEGITDLGTGTQFGVNIT